MGWQHWQVSINFNSYTSALDNCIIWIGGSVWVCWHVYNLHFFFFKFSQENRIINCCWCAQRKPVLTFVDWWLLAIWTHKFKWVVILQNLLYPWSVLNSDAVISWWGFLGVFCEALSNLLWVSVWECLWLLEQPWLKDLAVVLSFWIIDDVTTITPNLRPHWSVLQLLSSTLREPCCIPVFLTMPMNCSSWKSFFKNLK